MNELWVVKYIIDGYPYVEAYTSEVEAVKAYEHIGNTQDVYGLSIESVTPQENFTS